MRAIGRAFIIFSFAMALGLGPVAMSAEPDAAKLDAAKPEAKPAAPLAYISVAGVPGGPLSGARMQWPSAALHDDPRGPLEGRA